MSKIFGQIYVPSAKEKVGGFIYRLLFYDDETSEIFVDERTNGVCGKAGIYGGLAYLRTFAAV